MSKTNHAGPVQQNHNRMDGLYTAGIPGCPRCAALETIHDREVILNGRLRVELMDLKAKIKSLTGALDTRRSRIYVPCAADFDHSNGTGDK